jgi:transposase
VLLHMMAAVVVMEDVMGKLLVPDELWELIEPILPKHEPSPKGGKPRKDDRLCLTGILFVLKSGIPWEDFPQEMGCCGMTLWNRLDEWRKAGVWDQLHRLLLDKLRGQDAIDFSRVVVDSSSVRAVHGGKKPGPAPWTAGRTAPSTIWRSMPTGRLWPVSSPAPTATT